MGNEAQSSPPRWILVATAVAGLVAAVFIAAAKYYELHKARAEAAEVLAKGKSSAPSDPEWASSSWSGNTADGLVRLVMETVKGEDFTGQHSVIVGGEVKHQARVRGKVLGKNLSYSYRREDIVIDGGFLPCRFDGIRNGRSLSVDWQVPGGGFRGHYELARE